LRFRKGIARSRSYDRRGGKFTPEQPGIRAIEADTFIGPMFSPADREGDAGSKGFEEYQDRRQGAQRAPGRATQQWRFDWRSSLIKKEFRPSGMALRSSFQSESCFPSMKDCGGV
jgi:hypothetical protein